MCKGRATPSSSAIAKGAVWAAMDGWIKQGTGLVTFIVIGAIIGPHAYGVMAIGLLYHAVLASIMRDGYGEALIQYGKTSRLHFDTVFWTQLALGIAGMTLSFFIAGPMAALFGEPQLVLVVQALGVTFPFLSLSSFYRSVLRRRLNFKALAIRSAFACFVSMTFAIVLAVQGYGIVSLIAYQITFYGADLVAMAFQGKWAPRFRFSIKHYIDLADFSYKTMGNFFISNVGSQADRFVIGYFVGAGGLGFYSMARRIVDGIDLTMFGVINTIGLPAFARVQHERQALRKMLYASTHFAMLIACPVYAGLALVAPNLMAVALPDEWLSAAPVLMVLCLSGFFFPASAFLVSCQRALGHTGLLLKLAMLQAALRVVLCLAAALAGFGLMGVVFAIALSSFILIPVRIYFSGRAIGMKTFEYLNSMRVPVLATLAMIGAVYGLEKVLAPYFDKVVVLAAMVGCGVLSYVGALSILSPRSLKDIFTVFFGKRGAALETVESGDS